MSQAKVAVRSQGAKTTDLRDLDREVHQMSRVGAIAHLLKEREREREADKGRGRGRERVWWKESSIRSRETEKKK